MCPGLQQGPRLLHHAVALSAPGSPGPPPFFPLPPALSSGWGDDETVAAPGVRGQSSGSAEAGDHLGTQGRPLGLCPLMGVGCAHCLVWGWAGHQVVCARIADHD